MLRLPGQAVAGPPRELLSTTPDPTTGDSNIYFVELNGAAAWKSGRYPHSSVGELHGGFRNRSWGAESSNRPIKSGVAAGRRFPNRTDRST